MNSSLQKCVSASLLSDAQERLCYNVLVDCGINSVKPDLVWQVIFVMVSVCINIGEKRKIIFFYFHACPLKVYNKKGMQTRLFRKECAVFYC